jgi:thiamine pyrophosphokinase
MPTCALIGATEFNTAHFARQRFDCVVAVDAGYASLTAIGYEPDVVVGDFDSLGYVPDAVNLLRLPCEKGESDMEMAVRVAVERGCDTLLLYGALGRRMDHTLANLQVMVGCARRGLRVAAVDAECAVVALDGQGMSELAFAPFDPTPLDAGAYGRFLSLFAYGSPAYGVCEEGLKYALRDATVPDDVSLGLSNEFTGERARLSVGCGNVLVTFSLAAWEHLL